MARILTAPPRFPSLAATTSKLFHSSSPQKLFPKFTTTTKTLSHCNTLRAKPNSDSAIGDFSGVFDESFFLFDHEIDDEGEEEEEVKEEEDEENESSLELLLRFLQSLARNVSKRAKKASRSVLPPAIPTQLVCFGVDGFMVLASLSIVKALLQVICTLGGTVFVSILLLRVIWATVSYFQASESDLNQRGSSYGSAQSVS